MLFRTLKQWTTSATLTAPDDGDKTIAEEEPDAAGG
jgi:hypothetical protein